MLESRWEAPEQVCYGRPVWHGSRRLVGLELELAGFGKYSCYEACRRFYNAGFEGHLDGSIPDGGREIVSNPASGVELDRAIDKLAAAVTATDAFAHRSCGLHVHVDARDLGAWQLQRLVENYANVEREMFKLCPPWRGDTQYAVAFCDLCEPIITAPKSSQDIRKALVSLLYADSVPRHMAERYFWQRVASAKREKCGGERYFAMNLASYYFRGTVEFRHQAALCEAEDIRHWARVCAALVDSASGVKRVHKIKDLTLPDSTREWVAQGGAASVTMSGFRNGFDVRIDNEGRAYRAGDPTRDDEDSEEFDEDNED